MRNGNFFGNGVPVAQIDTYTRAQIDALFSAYLKRNLIINGAMTVAQRGTSATGITTSGYYTVDRWKLSMYTAGTWTMEQGTGLGDHGNSLKVTCTTADASLGAGDYVILSTLLEGQDLQHLKKGTADAKSLSLGLLVKSDETKTFVCEIYDNDNARHIAGTMTITSSGVEQEVSFTFPGDTSGVFDNDANASLIFNIWLAAGTNFTSGTLPTTWQAVTTANRAAGCDNLADAVNNYFEITGVQLEVGDVASDFVHESYGETFGKCSRYYQVPVDATIGAFAFGRGAGSGYNVTANLNLVTPMRTTPSITSTGSYHVADHNSRTSATPTSLTATAGTGINSSILGVSIAFSSVVVDDDRVCNVGANGAVKITLDSEI